MQLLQKKLLDPPDLGSQHVVVASLGSEAIVLIVSFFNKISSLYMPRQMSRVRRPLDVCKVEGPPPLPSSSPGPHELGKLHRRVEGRGSEHPGEKSSDIINVHDNVRKQCI